MKCTNCCKRKCFISCCDPRQTMETNQNARRFEVRCLKLVRCSYLGRKVDFARNCFALEDLLRHTSYAKQETSESATRWQRLTQLSDCVTHLRARHQTRTYIRMSQKKQDRKYNTSVNRNEVITTSRACKELTNPRCLAREFFLHQHRAGSWNSW